MKLLFENWRQYLNELRMEVPEDDPEVAAAMVDVTTMTTEPSKKMRIFLEDILEAYTNFKRIYQQTIRQLVDRTELNEISKFKPKASSEVIKIIDLARKDGWHMWYENNYASILNIFKQLGVDDEDLLKTFLDNLGATSQASSVPINVTLAIKGLEQQYIQGASNPEDFNGFLNNVKINLARIKAKEDVKGPKVGPYTKALKGDVDAIAVDRHVFEAIFGVQTISKGRRRAAMDLIINIASRLNLDPRQIQASLWAGNQIGKGSTPGNYLTYINKKIDYLEQTLKEIKR